MGLDELFLTQAFARHYYTLACSGMKMHCKEFSSREQAKEYMYKLIDKHGLTLLMFAIIMLSSIFKECKNKRENQV